MDRIDPLNEYDLDESKPRYWVFAYLGARMAMLLAKGTLKQIMKPMDGYKPNKNQKKTAFLLGGR